MDRSYSEKQLSEFAEWHNQPLPPGQERKLNAWLAEDPSNQDTWESWQRINGRAKRLQLIPGDVKAEWGLLRDELGFQHTGAKRKKSRSGDKTRDFHRQPSVVAILSMIVYSLFLYLLHVIRITVGF